MYLAHLVVSLYISFYKMAEFNNYNPMKQEEYSSGLNSYTMQDTQSLLLL